MTVDHPQRITAPAAPGALLKRLGPRPDSEPRSVKRDGDEDSDYLAMVRQMPCLCCGMEPCGEAAHLRAASAHYGKSSGLGKRPADRWALPVCPSEHRIARDSQHNRNEIEFWESYDVNPFDTATKLYAQRGDLVAMQKVCVWVIMNRKNKNR